MHPPGWAWNHPSNRSFDWATYLMAVSIEECLRSPVASDQTNARRVCPAEVMIQVPFPISSINVILHDIENSRRYSRLLNGPARPYAEHAAFREGHLIESRNLF